MIENFFKNLTVSEKKVLVYSFVVGIAATAIWYLEFRFLGSIIGINPVRLNYDLSRIVYEFADAIVFSFGAILPFIVSGNKAKTIKFGSALFVMIIIYSTLCNYLYNRSFDLSFQSLTINNLSQIVFILPVGIIVTSLVFANEYKRSIGLSLLVVCLFKCSIMVLINYAFLFFLNSVFYSELIASFLYWPVFWLTLFFFMTSFRTIEEVIVKIKNELNLVSKLSSLEYRRLYLLTMPAIIFIGGAFLGFYKVFYLSFDIRVFFLVFFSVLLFILIFSLSIVYLIQRLDYLQLSRKYVWYRFIPILNIYLLYITLFRSDNNKKKG